MIKEYLLELYIVHLEKIFTDKDKKKREYTWNKIKTNKRLLEFVSIIENNTFKSNIIVSRILQDESLYKSEIYKNIIENIYSNKILASKKISLTNPTTFLMLTLQNKDLKLTKEQKVFLIFEAEKSPCTEKYYKEKLSCETSLHGIGLLDIRYKLLTNKNFSEQEKKNFFNMFYPDDEIKLAILKELEWEIIQKLKLNINSDNNDEIYELDFNDLTPEIIDYIKLCRYIKTTIPEDIIKSYMNMA